MCYTLKNLYYIQNYRNIYEFISRWWFLPSYQSSSINVWILWFTVIGKVCFISYNLSQNRVIVPYRFFHYKTISWNVSYRVFSAVASVENFRASGFGNIEIDDVSFSGSSLRVQISLTGVQASVGTAFKINNVLPLTSTHGHAINKFYVPIYSAAS